MISSTLINKIVNGDSLKELKKIPDESFDLIFADPPYNYFNQNTKIDVDLFIEMMLKKIPLNGTTKIYF